MNSPMQLLFVDHKLKIAKCLESASQIITLNAALFYYFFVQTLSLI